MQMWTCPAKLPRELSVVLLVTHGSHANTYELRAWRSAGAAAGLVGNPNIPLLDPRQRPLQVKNLPAYAGSDVVDSGGTQCQASTLPHHSDVQTCSQRIGTTQAPRVSAAKTPLGRTPASP